MRIWAFSANYSCLQGICCHFWPNLSPGAALGYLRNGALDRKTFLVKVGWYEVYKTHIEFGAIPRDEGAKFGILLKPVHLNRDRLTRFEVLPRPKNFLRVMSFGTSWDEKLSKQNLFTMLTY